MELKRGIDPLLLAEISNPSGFHPIVLAFIDWPGDPAWVHSNFGDIVWNSQTWLGIGQLGEIQLPEEGAGIVPSTAELSLVAGLDVVMAKLLDNSRGSEVELFFGATTEPGGTVLIGAPSRFFLGAIDGNDLAHRAAGDQIFDALSVTVKSGVPPRAAAAISHSNEDQQTKYPGDTFFRRCTMADVWGANPMEFPAP